LTKFSRNKNTPSSRLSWIWTWWFWRWTWRWNFDLWRTP